MMTLPDGVGWTSLITTYARAQESRRPDRVFEDPFAQRFVEAATQHAVSPGDELPRIGPARDDGSSPMWTGIGTYFACRSPFYDAVVTTGVAEGVRQVVILAAGLDARALRLELPAGTEVYELDTAAVLDFKSAVLGTDGDRAWRHPVEVDLRTDWVTPLRGNGFDPEQPTVWLIEGLLMYLSAAQADRLVDEVAELSAPGSRIALEYFTRTPRPSDFHARDAQEQGAAEMLTQLFAGGPDTAPGKWLADKGWRTEPTDLLAELGRLGREVPSLFADQDPDDPVNIWLASGSR
jgi:methyltransferase (TIGR00027 family)